MVKQGDVLKINFNPQVGHEQAGFRPAVVVSNKLLNNKLTLALLCPITHTKRNNAFHYELVNYDFVDGFVMCDQLKTMDLSKRGYAVIGSLRDDDIIKILDRIEMLIERE